jgi:putative membrane protein
MNIGSRQKYIFGAMMVLPLSFAGQSLAGQTPQSTNAAGMPLSETGSRAVSQTNPGATTNVAAMTDSSMNGSIGNDTQLAKDMLFVRKTEEGGLAEIQFGQLAAQKASSDDVKKLGQKMVDDHTSLSKDMNPIADSLGVRVPEKLSKADQDEYNKLNSLSGADFDKEYLAVMLKDHRKDLREYRQEAMVTTDPDLKDAVANGSKMIAQHLYTVNALALANGVPGAYKPKPSPAAASTPAPK